MSNPTPRAGWYAAIITPAAALATPADAVWYSESTNRGVGSSLEPVIEEIIALALDFFPQLDRSSLILFSTNLGGTYAALVTTDNTQPTTSTPLATVPPPRNFPNAVTLCTQMTPGPWQHSRALGDILRDLKRGWGKEIRMLGPTPQQGLQRFWVSYRDGSRRACSGFNRMDQRPFEDQTVDL